MNSTREFETMSRTRYRVFEREYPYFLTNTVVAWLPIFARPEFAAIVLDSWRFLQRERDVRIFGFVILENHLHWIARADDLVEQVGRFKSFTARRILDEMKARGYRTVMQELEFFRSAHKLDQLHQFWQEGSHPQQITSDEMMEQKLDYVHANPVRRGYVDDAVHWRYSSARNYAGLPGLVDVVTDWH